MARSSKEKVKGAAKTALEVYERSGYDWKPYAGNEQVFASHILQYDVIIDALLGIGIKGEVRSPYKEIIQLVNRSRAFVYAIDLPSGTAADGGEVETAVCADVTITIQCPKLGAYTFPAADFTANCLLSISVFRRLLLRGMPHPVLYGKRTMLFGRCQNGNGHPIKERTENS